MGSGLGRPATTPGPFSSVPLWTCCSVSRFGVWGLRVESSPSLRLLSAFFGLSPSVCQRLALNTCRVKVLKAPAVLSLCGLAVVLAASARWLMAGSWLEQAMGSGLGHPATTPGPFSTVLVVDLLIGFPL